MHTKYAQFLHESFLLERNKNFANDMGNAFAQIADSHCSEPLKRLQLQLMDFAVHVAVVSTMFCIVTIPAVLLSILVHWLEQIHVPQLTVNILMLLENAILIFDAASVIFFLSTTSFGHKRGGAD